MTDVLSAVAVAACPDPEAAAAAAAFELVLSAGQHGAGAAAVEASPRDHWTAHLALKVLETVVPGLPACLQCQRWVASQSLVHA